MSTMTTTKPMIVTDEEAGRAVVWYGGATFNVHLWFSMAEGDGSLSEEVDVFTRGDTAGTPPTPGEAYRFACEWLARQDDADEEG